MLELKSRQISTSEAQTAVEASEADLQQRVEELQRADRSLYNLMGMEVWAIAKTMDDIYPGFWHQFMENRRIACKQFMEQQKQAHRSED
jgi:two-component sensor histidine kinase